MTYLCILFSLYKPQIQAFKFVDTDVNLDKTFRFTRWFLFFPLFDTKHTWNVLPLCHSNGLLVCTPLFLFYSTNYLFIHKLRERIKFETFQCFNGVVLSSVMFLILYQIRILCIQLGRILLRFHFLHVVYEHEPSLNKVWQYHLVRMNSKKIPIELKPKNFRK